MIAADYFEVYLEFLKENGDDYKRVREILKKYEDRPQDAYGFK